MRKRTDTELIKILNEVATDTLPLKKSNERILKELLKDLIFNEITSEDEISTVLHIFGEGLYYEAREEVEKFLKHKDCILRHSALSTLVLHWGLREHTKTSIDFLLKDNCEDNRRLGAVCLGSLYFGTKNRRILSLLLKILRNKKEHPTVMWGVYYAIQCLVSIPPKERVSSRHIFDSNKDVDWNLIESLEKELGLKNKSKLTKVKK